MFKINNFTNNDDVRIVDQKGQFTVAEYIRDLSVTPATAMHAYFCNEMHVRKKHLICTVGPKPIVCQSGAMQWTVGNVEATTGIKGAGDLVSKAFRGKVTGESTIKPEYKGNGALILEPTYKHILLYDIGSWGGSVILDDGLFLACEGTIQQKATMRSNLSSAVAGGQGLFNLSLHGNGVFALESYCPKEELIEIELQNDVLKVDGNFAIAWSSSLDFSVERSGKTLVGSSVSGEGLVNVYRGTGKVLLAPVAKNPGFTLGTV